MPMANVNITAVLVAAIASFVIGGLWYGPLFGKLWVKLSGFGKKELKAAKEKGVGMTYVLGFIATLVTAYVLAFFVDYTQATTINAGIQTGSWIWLGFVAPVLIGSVLWEGKPFKLFVLNAAHWLVSLGVMASILAVWV